MIDGGLGLCAAEKHYAGAVNLYSKAIDISSDNPVYWANRAFAHIKLEEYGSAVADATKAIEVDPSYAKVRGASGLNSTSQTELYLIRYLGPWLLSAATRRIDPAAVVSTGRYANCASTASGDMLN